MTRPTSRDVANAAGVSQATVSLVLGDKWRGRVSERTATHVRETAAHLGYRPNLAARNLRLGSTRTALLVVPALTNEFFARVYTGAAQVAAEHGFGVVLYPSPDGTGPARNPFASARAALDGVIASSMAADALDAIGGNGLPLVMLDSDPTSDTAAAHVNLAMADGMRQTVEHLLTHGHRRFLHLASAVDSWTFHTRARALTDLLPAPAELRTVRAPLTVTGARTALETALTTPGPRPTAVICDDDILAMRRLQSRPPPRPAHPPGPLRHRLRRPRPRHRRRTRTHHRPPARRTRRPTRHDRPPHRPRRPPLDRPRHPRRTRRPRLLRPRPTP